MAHSPILTATLQSTFLGALSSVLAQLITAYKDQVRDDIPTEYLTNGNCILNMN